MTMRVPLQLAFLTAGSIAATASASDQRPNFMVIFCDDLSWGDIAANGHPHIRTPNLDWLAAGGVRLTSFYSTSPVCSHCWRCFGGLAVHARFMKLGGPKSYVAPES